MDELYPPRMQTDAAIRIAALGAVLQIALDGATDSRQLATYLVVTAGLQIHFEQGIVIALDQRAIIENSQFGIFGSI